jgi:hypothetical protein
MKRFGLAAAIMALGCSNSPASSDGGADASTDSTPSCSGLTGQWACVGQETTPAPSSSTVAVSFGLTSKSQPVANAPVKACAIGDVTCSTSIDSHTTDSTGTVMFAALPTGTKGFDGYFEVDFPNDMPNLNFNDPPIYASSGSVRTFWSGALVAETAQAVGVTLDPSRGTLLIEAHDCTEFPSNVSCLGNDAGCPSSRPGGVSLSINVSDPKIVTGYITDQNGSVVASRTATCTADKFGAGGFFNVPPGPVTITGTLTTQQTMATLTVFVRAGAVSLVVLPPTP